MTYRKIISKSNLGLGLVTIYAVILLVFRFQLTEKLYLLFLIKNLFLGIIPYLISSKISYDKSINKYLKHALLIAWLLIIPNSFYMITDLVHLKKSSGHLFYLDLTIICSFAFVSYSFGIKSCKQIYMYFNTNRIKEFFTPLIFILIGFGIYLGRFLRFNSWDIITKPMFLTKNIFRSLLETKAMFFSFQIGVFIYITFITSNHFKIIKNK